MSGMFYIVCYDTPSDKRRRKLHKLLKNFAVAVQKSVFETFLEEHRFDEMVNKISRVIDHSADSVRIYGMSREAQKRMKVFGFPGLLEDPDHYIITDDGSDLSKLSEIDDCSNEDVDEAL